MTRGEPAGQADTVLRAITDDGSFRVIAVRTTATVRGAIAAQKATGSIARVFAEVLTATTLVRETMSPDLRVQGIVQASDKKSRMVADSHPDGATRGIVQMAAGAKEMSLAQGGLLQVMRSLHNGALHQGIVEVPAAGGVSGALMTYLQTSENVLSTIALGCIMDGSEVSAAGGYVVQLLPEASQGPLMLMAERLKAFDTIEHLLASGGAEPSVLLSEILFGMPYTRVGEGTVRFHCHCSQARVAASLSTLPRHEIEGFIAAGNVLEIGCDYCHREYAIAPEQLRGLLQSN